VRLSPKDPGPPPARFGTVELFDMAGSVVAMAASLQRREAATLTFIDHVTHELKTPVSTLRAATELLEDSPALGPEDRHLLGQIASAAAQMQVQLEALQRVAKARESDHRGVTRLEELAADLDSFGLAIRIEGGALPLPLSAAGLRVVLGHLLGNAAAHGATEVLLAASDAPGATLLRVADNGAGITEGNRARIFDPFFTTRRTEGGTGMGLTIVASLLRVNGAEIALEEGCRTAFLIRFPPL
jgi:signal transduction histidine kinase